MQYHQRILNKRMAIIAFTDFIEITLQRGCSPVNLLHVFRMTFLKNTSGGLLLFGGPPPLLKNTDRETIFESSLISLWSALPGKNIPLLRTCFDLFQDYFSCNYFLLIRLSDMRECYLVILVYILQILEVVAFLKIVLRNL